MKDCDSLGVLILIMQKYLDLFLVELCPFQGLFKNQRWMGISLPLRKGIGGQWRLPFWQGDAPEKPRLGQGRVSSLITGVFPS